MEEVNCGLCGSFPETVEHLLVNCCYARNILSVIVSWVKLSYAGNSGSIQQVLELLKQLKVPKELEQKIWAILAVTFWLIWKARNAKIHDFKECTVNKLLSNIKLVSYLWVKIGATGSA
ncbi:uncharacterized protein LOC143555110 [Bidens hawaiensis]|uniref:uncharacterized protein LOC143555110 n=1 Tax=Bidens hawaiensis TaxID=980011 RepID=UPI00404AEC2F